MAAAPRSALFSASSGFDGQPSFVIRAKRWFGLVICVICDLCTKPGSLGRGADRTSPEGERARQASYGTASARQRPSVVRRVTVVIVVVVFPRSQRRARPHLQTRPAKLTLHFDPTDFHLSRENGSLRFEERLHTGRGGSSTVIRPITSPVHLVVHRRAARRSNPAA